MTKVTAAVIEKDGRILIARRKKGDRFEGLWEFPGGKLEAGETPESCLRRELREEFGVEAEIGDLLLTHTHRSDDLSIDLITFRVNVASGEFRLTDHDQIIWAEPSQLNSYRLAAPDRAVAQQLQREWQKMKP